VIRICKPVTAASRGILLGAALFSAHAAFAKTHEIRIEGLKFTPSELTVKKGDTITWKNMDIVPHTATAADGSFDSKMIEAGKKFTFKAKALGEHSFVCQYHPTMKGSISVK